MRRIRVRSGPRYGREVLCVMRRSPGDQRVNANMCWDRFHQEWDQYPPSMGTHVTSDQNYNNAIVYFTDGVIGLVRDDMAEEALAALGIREVRT